MIVISLFLSLYLIELSIRLVKISINLSLSPIILKLSILLNLILILFLLIIFSFWVIYFLNRDFFELKTLFIYLEIIQNYISNNFFISFLIFTFTYCFLIVCNFPAASLLSLIGGFLYGTWIGGIGIIIGGTIGAFIVFYLAKLFFHDYISKKLLHKYSFIIIVDNK